MSKISQVLLLLVVVLLGASIYMYMSLKDCRKVPDFIPSLSHVKKFTGYVKSFRFYVECTGKKVFEDCDVRTPQDVTERTVIMRMMIDGNVGKSSYVVDWVEDIQYYVDLSNPESWNIDIANRKVIFTSPEIEFDRILRNEAYLPYVKDRKVWKDDEDVLLRLVMRTHEISESKSREYLKQHREAINSEMEKSIKGFIRAILEKLNYPEGIDIKVVYKNT